MVSGTRAGASEGNPVTRQRATEPGPNGASAAGIVGVVRRQGPNSVNVIREDDQSADHERALAPHGSEDGSQQAGMAAR